MRSTKEDPLAKVEALRVGNQARWQQAFELAQMMVQGETQYPGLKQNSQLASQVASLLDEEVDAARTDDNSINLRCFLCRILGEFQADDGLSALLRTAREDRQRDVRREAINALAVLAHAFNTMAPPQVLTHPELVTTLVELANERDELLRSQAAYALGVFAMQQDADVTLIAELQILVDDPYADARYNAALALARLGNLHAVETVLEMLDADALTISVDSERTPSLQAFKRDTILRNALEASRSLWEKNPHLDLIELTDAVRRFTQRAPQWQEPAAVPSGLVEQAQELLTELSRRPSS